MVMTRTRTWNYKHMTPFGDKTLFQSHCVHSFSKVENQMKKHEQTIFNTIFKITLTLLGSLKPPLCLPLVSPDLINPIKRFLDALASLGSMLESDSLSQSCFWDLTKIWNIVKIVDRQGCLWRLVVNVVIKVVVKIFVKIVVMIVVKIVVIASISASSV